MRILFKICLPVWLLALAAACSAPDDFPVKVEPEILDDGATTVLRRGNGAEPETLDPHRAQSVGASNILRDLYEGLISKAPDGELEPGGAESWTISDDRRVYTFKLRQNALWSNGEPVTARDYVYGLRRSVDPLTGSAYAQILAPVVNAGDIIAGDKDPQSLGVEAVDDYTLRITLNQPTPYFLGLLTHSSTYPLYEPVVQAHPSNFTQPAHAVTNGAYRMSEWVVASHIRVVRNPSYWDDLNTGVDQVVYLPITDVASELKRYQAGELDWTAAVPVPQLDRVRYQVPDQLQTVPWLGVYYYGLNVTRPPFRDSPKLRRALSMAIDREIICERITRGGETPAYSWVPPAVSDYEPPQADYAGWARERRLDQARTLYREAGYGPDNPLTLELRYNTSESHKKLASVVANMWRVNLGVKVTLINEEWKVFLQNVRQRQVTQVYRAGWIGDYDDPQTFLSLLHSDFGLNGTGFSNDRYDELLDTAARTPAGEKRRALMQQAEALLLEAQPVIPVYFYTSKTLLKPYVKGFVGNPMGHYYSKDLSIEWGGRDELPGAELPDDAS